jgi:hypothetical protein
MGGDQARDVGLTIAKHPPARQELGLKGHRVENLWLTTGWKGCYQSYSSAGPKALLRFANTAKWIGGHKGILGY